MTGIDFIGVMKRDDTREILSLMARYYETYFGVPGWMENPEILPSKEAMIYAAHDMIRLANSIARPAHDLMREIRGLEYEIELLKMKLKPEKT